MITDHIVANDIAIEEMMWLAMQGGAFELLAEEPEFYSPEDSKPAKWLQNAANAELLNKHAVPKSLPPKSAGHTKSRRIIF
ncbi:hypothetical protein L0337_41930 [candidate division KSB1 bacterium]|nr:hypothetical protein [candidate division KSB1 bacterium]